MKLLKIWRIITARGSWKFSKNWIFEFWGFSKVEVVKIFENLIFKIFADYVEILEIWFDFHNFAGLCYKNLTKNWGSKFYRGREEKIISQVGGS